MKHTHRVFFLILTVCFFVMTGCASDTKNVRRIRVTDAPEYRYQKTSVKRVGTVSRNVSRSIGPIGGSILSAAGYSVVHGVAVFGQSVGYSMIGSGGLKPLLGAILYVPASALRVVR